MNPNNPSKKLKKKFMDFILTKIFLRLKKKPAFDLSIGD